MYRAGTRLAIKRFEKSHVSHDDVVPELQHCCTFNACVFVYPRYFSWFFSRAWKRWETSAPRLTSRPKCRPATPCRENTPLSASARNGSVTSTSTGVSCRAILSLLGSGSRRSLPAHDLRGARARRRGRDEVVDREKQADPAAGRVFGHPSRLSRTRLSDAISSPRPGCLDRLKQRARTSAEHRPAPATHELLLLLDACTTDTLVSLRLTLHCRTKYPI